MPTSTVGATASWSWSPTCPGVPGPTRGGRRINGPGAVLAAGRTGSGISRGTADPNHAASPDGAQGSLTDPGEASVGGTGTSDRRLRTGLTERPDGRSDVPRGDRSPRKHDKDPVRLCTIIVDKRWTNPRYGANRTQRTGQPNGRRAEAPRDLPSGVTAVRAPPCSTAPEPPAAVIDDVTIATPTRQRRAPGRSGPARTKPHTDPQTQITANRFRGGVWCTRKKTQGRRSADEHPS